MIIAGEKEGFLSIAKEFSNDDLIRSDISYHNAALEGRKAQRWGGSGQEEYRYLFSVNIAFTNVIAEQNFKLIPDRCTHLP